MALQLMFALLCSLVAASPVQTHSGAVRGNETGNVTAFYRVPYAAPPVGPLRFVPPQPAVNWTGIRDASRVPTGDEGVCLQLPPFGGTAAVGSEDCLTLDVYTPDVAGVAPVMLFLHGGAFSSGGSLNDWDSSRNSLAPAYDGQEMVRAFGVVMVSINYRLGVLGLLGLNALAAEPGSGNATGNYALQDQQFAMRWVRDNIAAFGGHPSMVTIFGESAGASSICYHLVMPGSAGLFAGAIMESGVCNGPGQDTPVAQKQDAITAAISELYPGVCCEKNSTCVPDERFVDCLRSRPAADLVGDGSLTASIAAPSVDGVVIPGRFAESLRAGVGNKVPVIIGTNKYDATAASSDLTEALETFGNWSPEMQADPNAERKRLEILFRQFGAAVVFSDTQWAKVEAEYPLEAYSSRADRMNFLLTHAAFSNSKTANSAWWGHCADDLNAAEYAKFSGKGAWVYSFDAIDGAKDHDFIKHGDDLAFVFGHTDQSETAEWSIARLNQIAARGVAHVFGTYWTQFAKTLDPNSPQLPAWSRYTGAAPFDRVLIINGTTPTIAVPPYQDKCEFWQELLGDESRVATATQPRLMDGTTYV